MVVILWGGVPPLSRDEESFLWGKKHNIIQGLSNSTESEKCKSKIAKILNAQNTETDKLWERDRLLFSFSVSFHVFDLRASLFFPVEILIVYTRHFILLSK